MKKNVIKTFPNEVYTNTHESVDYMNYVTRTSTLKQRKQFNIGPIFINGAVCLKCKEFIRSTNTHSYKTCKCGAVSVDGGSWYAKRRGNTDNYIDVIEPFYKTRKNNRVDSEF